MCVLLHLEGDSQAKENRMSLDSRRIAGILLVVLPTVVGGGLYLAAALAEGPSGEYLQNKFRQDLFRAGHAHAGVLLVLSLVILRYVDECELSAGLKHFARVAVPSAAILMPLGFFLSVWHPASTRPNGMIYLVYLGALFVVAGVLVVGVGLLRKKDGSANP